MVKRNQDEDPRRNLYNKSMKLGYFRENKAEDAWNQNARIRVGCLAAKEVKRNVKQPNEELTRKDALVGNLRG